MAMPTDVPVIDLLMGLPRPDPKPSYDFLKPLLRDQESLKMFEFPVEYMFKDVPKTGTHDDYLKYALEEMDKYGVERGLIAVYEDDDLTQQAARRHPDRFIPSCETDPNQGVDAVRHIQRMHDEFGIQHHNVLILLAEKYVGSECGELFD